MFEFGTFAKSVFPNAAAFCEQLDGFLGALPGGFRYGVEIRNREYLGPDYFAMLAKNHVCPCLQRLDADARDGRAGRNAGGVHW